MIIEKMLDMLLTVPNKILEIMPSLDVTISSGVFDIFDDLMYTIGFIFPVPQLMILFLVTISITSFRIIWAAIMTVKSWIPFMGG